jgi:hypothetical protein
LRRYFAIEVYETAIPRLWASWAIRRADQFSVLESCSNPDKVRPDDRLLISAVPGSVRQRQPAAFSPRACFTNLANIILIQ